MCICKRTTPLYCSGQTLSVGKFCILYSLCAYCTIYVKRRCQSLLQLFILMGNNPQHCPFPLGDPGPHLTHGSLGQPGHPSAQPKRHLDRFNRFCGVHRCVQQTDRDRHRPRYYIDSNRPHFCTLRMRRGLIILIKVVWYVDRASLPSIGAEEEPGREGTTSER